MTEGFEISKIYDSALRLVIEAFDANGDKKIDSTEWNSIMNAVSDGIKNLDEYKKMKDFFRSQNNSEEDKNDQKVEPKTIEVEPEKLYRSKYDLEDDIKSGKVDKNSGDIYVLEYYNGGKAYKLTWEEDKPKYKLIENAQFQLNTSETVSKKGKNRKEKKWFAGDITEEIGKGNIKTLDELEAFVLTDGKYPALSAKIGEYIAFAKKQNHETVAGIKQLKKSLNNEIKEDKNIPNNARKKIVDAIVYTFVLENIQTAYTEINNGYEKYAKDKEYKVSYTQAEIDIKQRFADKIKDKNTFYKDAYNIFVENLSKKDAQSEITRYVYENYFADDKNVGTDDYKEKYEKKKDIKRELKAEHQQTGDKIYKKQVKSNKSEIKLTQRHNKAMNRQNELKSITWDDIEKGLNRELRYKLQAYLNKKEDKDAGTYDLSELSEAILKAIGADYLVNQSDDPTLSEIEKVRSELIKLRDLDNAQKLTDQEVKKLIKFCKIKLQKNDHTPIIANAAGGAVAGGAAGGASKLVSNSLAKDLEIMIKHEPIIVNISEEITADDLQALVKILEDNNFNVTVDNDVNGTISTVIEILQNPDKIKILAPKLMEGVVGGIIKGALAGLIVGVISTLIFGNPHGERACIDISDYDVNNTTFTNKGKYVKYLKMKGDYEKVKTILEWFPEKENGDWDHKQYFNFLRTIAGNAILNCDELYAALLSTRKKDIEPLLQEPVRGQKYTKTITTLGETKTYELSKGDILENAHKYDWVDIVGMYDCLNNGNMPEQKAIKIMKVIQAIEPDKLEPPGQYNLDKIEEIVEKAFEKPSYKPNWQYINDGLANEFPFVNKDKLKEVLLATCLGDKESHKLIVPAKLYRNDGDPCEKTTDPVQSQRRYKDAQAEGDDIKNNVSITTKYTVTTSGTEESKWWIRKPNESWKLVKENEYNEASDLEVLTDESEGLPNWDTQ